jgi:hypothetical protein
MTTLTYTQTTLLKRIERLGSIPPSKLQIGHALEIKQLLRDLYRYVRDGDVKSEVTNPVASNKVEDMKEEDVADLFGNP